MGALPIFTALIAWAVGLERLSRRFLLAGAVSFGGVALVALGSGGGLSANLRGDLLVLATAATWAVYSVAIAPLMRRYSPFRISAFVLARGLGAARPHRPAAARRARTSTSARRLGVPRRSPRSGRSC